MKTKLARKYESNLTAKLVWAKLKEDLQIVHAKDRLCARAQCGLSVRILFLDIYKIRLLSEQKGYVLKALCMYAVSSRLVQSQTTEDIFSHLRLVLSVATASKGSCIFTVS